MIVSEVKKVRIGNKFDIGGTERFTLIAGPVLLNQKSSLWK